MWEMWKCHNIYLYLTHKHANKSNMERKRTFMQYILPTPPPSIMSKFKTNQVPNYLRNVEKDWNQNKNLKQTELSTSGHTRIIIDHIRWHAFIIFKPLLICLESNMSAVPIKKQKKREIAILSILPPLCAAHE